MQIDIHNAKYQLTKLAERVERGGTIVITRAGKPWVELVPHRPRR